MRTYKPTYTTNGKQRTSPRYHVEFKDHTGVRHRLVAFTDKARIKLLLLSTTYVFHELGTGHATYCNKDHKMTAATKRRC